MVFSFIGAMVVGDADQERAADDVSHADIVIDTQEGIHDDVGDRADVASAGNDGGKKTAGEKKGAEGNNKTGSEGVGEEEEEEEETCGFCRFMKGGSCKATFVAWENCVDAEKEAGGDFVEKCQKQTEALRDCMLADPGYYGDMLPSEGDEKAGGAAAENEKGAGAPETGSASRAARAVTLDGEKEK